MRALPLVAAVVLSAFPAFAQPDDSGRVKTTSEANQESLGSAMKAPLRDLNVVRTKIPPVLLEALDDPYKRPRLATCAGIVAAVTPLNNALGADLDEPSVDEDDLLDKGRDTAFGLVAGAASDVIPFRGWVRRLSGASRHDRTVQAAILSGAVRRAYLKGLGEARGCNPPATPSHMLSNREPTPPPGKPRYPVR